MSHTAPFPPAGVPAGPPAEPPAPVPPAQAPPPRRPTATVVAAALLAGLVGGGAGFGGAYALLGDRAATPVLATTPSAPTSTAAGTVAGAAAVATPSTVDIQVRTPAGVAEGSGVVLTADGAVLTNDHVVDGAREVTVTLADGTEHTATVVGTSPSYDLAVLRVEDVRGLTPATLGDSDTLAVGQQVVAIGSPQGLAGTVTTGIVSALDRTVAVTGDGRAVVYNGLQTDAPINQGNSGGPLVDLEGHVVGINSAIATAGQGDTGSIGLGFAIPVDQARRVAQEILDRGVATKPLLGVQAGAQGGGSPTEGGGATIGAVQAGSPAATGGIVAGDTVLRVGDARVADFADLVARIGAHAPGDTVPLTVRGSDGAERTVQVTLAGTDDREATSGAPQVPSFLPNSPN